MICNSIYRTTGKQPKHVAATGEWDWHTCTCHLPIPYWNAPIAAPARGDTVQGTPPHAAAKASWEG